MKRIISLAMILGIWSQTVYPAFADSTVVSKISVTKVVVGYKKITFSFHPAIFMALLSEIMKWVLKDITTRPTMVTQVRFAIFL